MASPPHCTEHIWQGICKWSSFTKILTLTLGFIHLLIHCMPACLFSYGTIILIRSITCRYESLCKARSAQCVKAVNHLPVCYGTIMDVWGDVNR
jgi:hypothetical protein